MGTILPYIGAVADIPRKWALCDGNNGTPNLTGRFLQGWGWDDFYARDVGEYIQEGLPNILGAFCTTGWEGFWGIGAFSYQQALREGQFAFTDAFLGQAHVDFNASHSSWIYGNSATVQPRSYVVMYIMKIQK